LQHSTVGLLLLALHRPSRCCSFLIIRLKTEPFHRIAGGRFLWWRWRAGLPVSQIVGTAQKSSNQPAGNPDSAAISRAYRALIIGARGR